MKKILVVDDEPLIRKLARSTLHTQDYLILEAGRGDEALDMARREHPDVVLLDVLMPGRNGLEVCRAIKSDPATSGIVVILLTGELDASVRESGQAAGADGFFTKPFSPLQLLEKIRECLEDGRRLPPQPPTGLQTSVPRHHPSPEELQRMEREQLLIYAEDLSRIYREEVARRRELQATYERLQEAEKMKDVFVSLVSHELRTPLSIIRGYLHLMARAAERGEELLGYLKPTLKASERLESLIQELLDFSKIRSGLVVFDKTATDVEELVREAVAPFYELAERRGQTLETAFSPALGSVRVDRDRIREALCHVLRNALQFTPEGGRIRVECSDEGSMVKIAVEDTGVGISPEERERIFEPFYQAGDYMVRSVEGLGMGLAICRHIIRDHGGSIEVESEPGRGSRFTLSIPRSYQDARERLAELQGRLSGEGAP